MYETRQFAEADRPSLLAFLRQDPANNLFLIGDVATFGVQRRRIAFWGALRGDTLAGVVMLLDTNACFYAPERACLANLVPLAGQAQNMSGELALMEDVLALLPPQRVTWFANEYFCCLDAQGFRPARLDGVRRAVPADLPLLADLYAQGESFRQRTHNQVVEYMEKQLATSRYFLAQAGKEAVSAAAAVAETDDSAMIVAVLTAPAARNQGYATGVMSALCADLLARGKTPHLFYREDNPAAGRVYHKIGFHHIGRWKLVRLVADNRSPTAES